MLVIDKTNRLVYIVSMQSTDISPQKSRRSAGPLRSTQSKTAILQAAIQVAQDDGYAAASIEKIARRAGAGKQTIYRWYGSKAALFVDAYAAIVPVEALEKSTGDAEADVTFVLTALFKIYNETAAGIILSGLVGASAEDPGTAGQIRAGLMVGRGNVLRNPLDWAIAEGNLPRDFCVETAIETVIALVWHRLLTAPNGLDAAGAGVIARRAIACGGIH